MSKRVALVLGSGGARGYAHIGVIEEIERRGYDIAALPAAPWVQWLAASMLPAS